MDIKTENELGVFSSSQMTQPEVQTFFAQHKMMIIKFDSQDHKHEIIQSIEARSLDCYQGIAVIQKKEGMERFREHFHRSCSYTDRMLKYAQCEQIFPTQFWEEVKQHGEIHVKLVKKIMPK
jgi:hypothetical protein